MTQVDELLHRLAERVEAGDEVERRATATARRALRAAVASEHKRRIAPPRRLGALVLIGGLAAAIAVLLALLPSGTGKHLGAQPASAEVVLERAARAISRQAWQPLKPGQWLYFRTLGSYPEHNGPASTVATSVEQSWLAVDGAARVVQRPGVVSPGDVLLFHRSRPEIRAEQRRQHSGSQLRVMPDPRPWRPWAGMLGYRQLTRLPTNPAELRRWIVRNAANPGSTCAPGGADCHVFSFVEALLVGGPLPPKLSAALYRVIARLPGMRVIGPTRDPLGRPGVAVGYFFRHQPGRAELIFNPTSGAFLAERGISLDPKKTHAPVGSIVYWTAIERQAVVQSDQEAPPSRRQ